MDGDHRILALNQIWVWTPSRAPEMDAEGQIQLVQGSKTSCSCSQVAYGSHLLKDLFLHLHPPPLSGAESRTTRPVPPRAAAHSLPLAIKMSIFAALLGDTARS